MDKAVLLVSRSKNRSTEGCSKLKSPETSPTQNCKGRIGIICVDITAEAISRGRTNNYGKLSYGAN